MPNHRLFLKIVGRAATLVLLANMAAALPQPSTEPRQSVVSRSQPERNRNPQLTAVTGPSWLQHLGRPFDETSMGKTGRLGPLEITADEELVRELAESVRGSGGEAVMLPRVGPLPYELPRLPRGKWHGCATGDQLGNQPGAGYIGAGGDGEDAELGHADKSCGCGETCGAIEDDASRPASSRRREYAGISPLEPSRSDFSGRLFATAGGRS